MFINYNFFIEAICFFCSAIVQIKFLDYQMLLDMVIIKGHGGEDMVEMHRKNIYM